MIQSLNTKVSQVMGHPAGLFILFFTEMWERFSYYGMRALLVLFLVSASGLGGWEWTRSEALELYALYTGLVYITPIFGGMIADKFIGYRNAIVVGAVLMTAGHASMAFETPFTFYLGLVLLIVGNGFFKPNISSIVGGLYEKDPDKKDAAYTIFYMGINAGAFLGILLCGYIGEKAGWSYGFGLAGIFMFFGMLMFWFAQKIFGNIGLHPKKLRNALAHEEANKTQEQKDTEEAEFVEEVPAHITRDRLIVISVLAFFTIFFWMAFEQAGGSMTIFAKDYTNRILSGNSANIFTTVNTIIIVVPLIIITYVLFLLINATFKKYFLSNFFLGLSFVIIWFVVIWMINKEFNTKAYEISYPVVESVQTDDHTGATKSVMSPVTEKTVLAKGAKVTQQVSIIRQSEDFKEGQKILLLDLDQKGTFKYVDEDLAAKVDTKIEATIVKEKQNEIEVPASWFGILNSLFIILFAPVFSKLWESKYNPSAPIKFAFGLILLGVGFGVLAYGSLNIPSGAAVASVSMVWLILAYFFHTIGELTLSPVGLSYVSKLAPANLVGLMFGVWFCATAIANWLAGQTGSLIDTISKEYSMAGFFLLFFVLPVFAGLILIVLNKTLIKKMHGIH